MRRMGGATNGKARSRPESASRPVPAPLLPGDHQAGAFYQDYVRRLRWSTPLLSMLVLVTLLVAAFADATLGGLPVWDRARLPALIPGLLSAAMVAFILSRIRANLIGAWVIVVALCLLELALALIATAPRGAITALSPIMLAIPLVPASFWIHARQVIVCCVACYACAFLLPWRVGSGGPLLQMFVSQMALFFAACLGVFVVTARLRDGSRLRQKHLEYEALHDSLTGLPTRRRFLPKGEEAVALARSSRRPLCLAFIDLDNFKRINDDRGHAVGDVALQVIARQIDQALHDDMVAARIGGEEFVLLLPGTPLDAGVDFVDTLRRGIAQTVIEDFSVTVSAGVAQLRTSETLNDLMIRADGAMLSAKAAGRNRVLVAQDPERRAGRHSA